MPNRTLPLALVVPIASGSDPDVIEIEDKDDPNFLDEMFEQCPAREEGKQCIYNWRTNFRDCVYCRRKTGLDE